MAQAFGAPPADSPSPRVESQESRRVSYTPSPTVRQFILSQKFINLIYSARGEGKTSGALMKTVYHAQQSPRTSWPLRWALVRDTRRNIGITTARTILEWFPRPFSHWRGKEDEPETITIFLQNTPALIFDCFGVNSADDMSRFQSYEASGGIWIEEPAPAATDKEFLSSGISEAALGVAITSCRGAKSPHILISENPPPATHWTAQLFHLEGYLDAGDLEAEMSTPQREARELLRNDTATFRVPAGENVALDEKTPGYRERNRTALTAMGRSDLVARLVEGRVGYAKIGEAVTPEFSGLHLFPGLRPIPHCLIYCGYDYGLWPACIISQIAPSGALLIHAAFVLPNAGMKQLIQTRIKPYLLNQPEFTPEQLTHIIHIGGPEGNEREQSDAERTAVRSILSPLEGLGGRYLRGPVGWEPRRQALQDALTRFHGDAKWVRVNPKDAAQLVHCLDGGWHYDSDSSGNIKKDIPSKLGPMPSLGDAFAHLVYVLLRPTRPQENDPFGRKEKRGPRPQPVNHYAGYRSRTGA